MKYRIHILDPVNNQVVHTVSHLVFARDANDAVWQIVRAYGFRRGYGEWRLRAEET